MAGFWLETRREVLGTWGAVAWDLRRSLPSYAEAFSDELETYTRGIFPGSHLDKVAPPVPQPPDHARVPTSRCR